MMFNQILLRSQALFQAVKLYGLMTVVGLILVPAVKAELFTGIASPPDIIELYTSEGCSSCPPADSFLSGLTARADLFRTTFPLAFHVDYWDYIGWKDPYAKPLFSQRQRKLAQAGNISQVFTPAFVVNGSEWRRWFSGDRHWPENQPDLATDWYLLIEAERGAGTTDEAESGIKVQTLSGKIAGGDESLADQLKGAHLHVAVIGMNRISEVSRGENKGRTLKHNFVVLDYYESPVAFAWTQMLTVAGDGLVVWVTNASGQPLRAVGGIFNK